MTEARSAMTAIVEDHALFRDTIAAVVASMPHLELGPVVATGAEALEHFAEDQPDLVLIDLSLDGMTGLELVGEIRGRWPDVLCVMLSGHRRSHYAEQALAAGARAYILKGRPDEFRTGVRAVLEGGTYVSPAVRPPGGGSG